MPLGLQRIRTVLIPKHEIDIHQGNLVDDDFHGFRFLFLGCVRGESIDEKSEIHSIFTLIGDQVGLRVAQFHMIQMNFAFQQVADVNFCLQRSNACQVIVIQIFDNNIIQKNTEVRRDGQATHFDVGTCFFREIATRESHRKLLNDRVLNGNKNTCDDGEQHHKND